MRYVRTAMLSIVVFALAGCSSSAASKASTGTAATATTSTLPSSLVALQNWKTAEHVNSRIGALVTATNGINNSINANSLGAIGLSCQVMSTAATKDLTASPAPVAAVETHWQTMLHDFQAVAAVCLQAVAHGPNAQLSSSLSTDIGDATTQMKQLFAAGG